MKKKVRMKVEEIRNKAEQWWEENAVVVMMCAPAVAGVLVKIISVTGKQLKLHKEQVIKDKTVWDPVVGHYWRLKRKLDKDEWLYITKRRKAGDMLGDILEELGVLR